MKIYYKIGGIVVLTSADGLGLGLGALFILDGMRRLPTQKKKAVHEIGVGIIAIAMSVLKPSFASATEVAPVNEIIVAPETLSWDCTEKSMWPTAGRICKTVFDCSNAEAPAHCFEQVQSELHAFFAFYKKQGIADWATTSLDWTNYRVFYQIGVYANALAGNDVLQLPDGT